MKRLLLIVGLLYGFTCLAQVQNATFSFNPSAFNEDEPVTITVSGVDPTIWNAGEPDNIYLWAWYFDLNGNFAGDSPTNGDWTDSNESQILTNNGNGTYSITLTPTDFYGTTGISQMGMLVKAKDGSGDKKSQDFLQLVGRVRVEITNPSEDLVIVESGENLSVSATVIAGGAATVEGTFEVYYNDVLVDSGTCGFPSCNGIVPNINESGEVRIVGFPPNSEESAEATFNVLVAPSVTQANVPTGMLDGINYTSDTSATLVLDAPGKEFIYVAGSFNNYERDSAYLMRKDPNSDKFWIALTGLTPGQIHTYQYWVYDTDPISNSPSEVKTADPYSTLVLSPFDDPFIPSSSFPNLPDYPEGQEREVTVLQPGQVPYDWQVTNFNKPKEEDLIVYEVLIRDFDANRNFQDLIDRIDYFKNLNINAIEIMPVMEFEGNESWGYNTAYHMALDKFYGTPEKFKELVDLCHLNGIAVILDVAFNHAFGRNPYVRMWMEDSDNDGWGGPASDSPYFNQFPTHAFNVGSDFNHSTDKTRNYVKRIVSYWIDEYKIDGFRWDLTKGFTQNCGNGTFDGNFNCTQEYQQDRVDVLKEYADHSWSVDPDHYVIFEHLGTANEEQQWANYRLDEGKGIMMWGKTTDPYNQLSMGFASNANIEGIGHESRGFNGKRLMGYAESHDEERLMYKNLEFGNTSPSDHNVQELDIALSRMSAIGAALLTVPGPKMIWHFGALGMENSIFTCQDGSVNNPDCKLDTKPQPQWVENWLGDDARTQIYDDWSRLIELKINEDVFEGNYDIDPYVNDARPRIYIWDDNLPSSQLKNVIVVCNFNTITQTIRPNFPYTGIWYDLMDPTGESTLNVEATDELVAVQPGQFKIYGNQPSAVLSTTDFEIKNVSIIPNPVTSTFKINTPVSSLKVFDITGKLVKEFNGDFKNDASFDISKLLQSMYIIQIKSRNGQTQTTKLVKL